MPRSLERLPFDIIYYVVAHLHFQDVMNLGKTSKWMSRVLQEETLCRAVVQVCSDRHRERRISVAAFANCTDSVTR